MEKPASAAKMDTWAGLDFVRIPAGPFWMGSRAGNEWAWDDEKPRHSLELPYDYWAARFPVSVAAFRGFVRAAAYVTRAEQQGYGYVWMSATQEWETVPGATWQDPLGDGCPAAAPDRHPVVQVCWYDAVAFCAWLNRCHGHALPAGYRFRLPGEAEWEKAARGPEGREWPWGDAFDPGRCNSRESGRLRTVETGSCSPQGDSPYGAADMSGNVWEWTLTLWGADRSTPAFVYPYRSRDGRENVQAGPEFYRIIRGGSFKDDLKGVRTACRDLDPPHWSLSNLGFRVFVAPVLQPAHSPAQGMLS